MLEHGEVFYYRHPNETSFHEIVLKETNNYLLITYYKHLMDESVNTETYISKKKSCIHSANPTSITDNSTVEKAK